MQPRHQATLTQPLQCVSQHPVANLHLSTHVATPDDNNHAAMPLRSATTDSKTPYNYAHTQAHPKQLEATVTMRQKKGQTDRSRTRRTHTRHLSSPAATTLHGKIEGFVLRLPPQTLRHPWCKVSRHNLTPSFIECILMWCKVSHQSLTPPCIKCILMWCKVSHQSFTPKSHTTLHWVCCYR